MIEPVLHSALIERLNVVLTCGDDDPSYYIPSRKKEDELSDHQSHLYRPMERPNSAMI